jgi:hypothetical protein
MAYTLTQSIGASHFSWRRSDAADDPLAPMRGILVGTVLSVLGFWLPLALMLAQ